MPRLTQRVHVEISRDGNQFAERRGDPGQERAWSVRIVAKEDLFFIPDFLAKQGLVTALESSPLRIGDQVLWVVFMPRQGREEEAQLSAGGYIRIGA